MTWRRRVELRVEAGLRGVAAGNMTWDISAWDSATWSGLEPAWVALANAEIESLSTSRGRDKAYNRVSAGTAELALVWRDVADRWSMRATSPIQLGQELRVMARVLEAPTGADAGAPATDYYPLYRGAVRSIVDAWDARTGVFRLLCRLVDRLADLGAVNLPEGAPTGNGDTTDERLLRILELADIDPSYSDLEAATVEHGSATFARNLLDEAQLTVESDAGASLYVDRDGKIRYRRPKVWQTPAGTRSTVSQMVWSNQAGVEPIGPTDFGTGQDLDDLRNSVSAARGGGTAYTAASPTSILRYGKRTNQRFDLTCRYDADANAWADFWLAELATRTQRIDAVSGEINPDADVERIADLLDVELLDRHEIAWHDGVGEVAGAFWVQGIRHRVTPRSWRVTVNLWAYGGYGFVPVAPAVATWGSATWGGAVWS